MDEPEEDIIAMPLAAPADAGEGVEAAGNAEMVEMTEDDILAALQSLENAGPRGDGRDDRPTHIPSALSVGALP